MPNLFPHTASESFTSTAEGMTTAGRLSLLVHVDEITMEDVAWPGGQRTPKHGKVVGNVLVGTVWLAEYQCRLQSDVKSR